MVVIQTGIKFRRPLIKLDPNKVEVIFIHHPKWKIASVETIHNDVLNDPNKKDWNGFPYNRYIRKDHKVYEGRGDNIGAHASNYNSRSYGLCVEGDYSVEPAPPDSLLRVVAEEVVETQRRFPKAKVVLPHSARYNTECPGKNFPMGKLYDFINEVYKNQNKPELHWVLEKGIYKELTEDFGIQIHEQRFDDPITRAESMALQLQGLRSMKRYIDSKK